MMDTEEAWVVHSCRSTASWHLVQRMTVAGLRENEFCP